MKGKRLGKRVKAGILAAVLLVGSMLGVISNRTVSGANGLPEYSMTAEKKADELVLKKELTSYSPETEEGCLTLEAYLSAETITQITSKPFDIVLVLDQSHSMISNNVSTSGYYVESAGATSEDDEIYVLVDKKYIKLDIERSLKETYTAKWKTVKQMYDSKYYFYDNTTSKYYPLNVGYKGYSGFYVYYEKNGVDTYLGTRLSQSDKLYVYDKEQIITYEYTYEDGKGNVVTVDPDKQILYKYQPKGTVTRLEALKRSVRDFVEIVRADSGDHRVAIVGFGADSKSNGTTTEILTADGECSSYSVNGKSGNIGVAYNPGKANYETALENALINVSDIKIDYAIDALASTANGTRTDLGMKMAKEILENAEGGEERGKLVVVLTDGVPTDVSGTVGGEFEPSGISGSFSHSVASGAIEYAKTMKNDYQAEVFVIGFTDDTSKYIGKFLDAMSSDYKYARGNSGKTLWYSRMGEECEDKYAYSIKAFEALNKAFVDIAMGMKEMEVFLDETSVMVDTMSAFFDLDAEKEIKLFTQTSKDGGQTWEGLQTDENLSYEIDGNRVIVSGFDYSENYVGKTYSGAYHAGKKLVLQVPIKGNDLASLGGNNLPTNDETSGIYDAAGTECFGNFVTPQVNRAIDYSFDVKDMTVHLGTEADLSDLIIIDKDEKYIPNGRNNLLVNITYTLNDGEKDIASLTIPAGTIYDKETNVWETKEDIISKFRTCKTYTVSCKISPIHAGQNNPGELAKQVVTDIKAHLHVLYPTVMCEDTMILLGEEIDYMSLISDGVSWTDMEIHEEIPEPCTVEPVLDIKAQAVEGSVPETEGTTFSPQEDTAFKIISIVSNDLEILNETTIVRNPMDHDSVCIKDKETMDYTIHVVPGSISITKEIEDEKIPLAGGNNYKNTGDPIFTFKIEKIGEGNQVEKVWYRIIHFTKEDPDVKDAELLEGMETGTYRITELQTQRYSLLDIKEGKNNECTYSAKDEAVTVVIGRQPGGILKNDASVCFVNKKTGNNGTPTDTDVKVNRFVYKDGEWIFEEAYTNLPGGDGD